MAIKKNKELKNVINGVVTVLNTLNNSSIGITKNGKRVDINLEDLYYETLRDYVLYLSCVDGFISKSESEFLEYYTGYYLTPYEMITRINKGNINSVRFAQKLPDLLQIIVRFENALFKSDFSEYGSTIAVMMKVYVLLGKEFCESANNNSTKTLFAYCQYVQNMNDLLNSVLIEEAELLDFEDSDYKMADGRKAPKKKYHAKEYVDMEYDFEAAEDEISDEYEEEIELEDVESSEDFDDESEEESENNPNGNLNYIQLSQSVRLYDSL